MCIKCVHLTLWGFCVITHDRSHYNDVIMGAVTSQITSLTIIYSTVDSDVDQRKHQSSVSLAFVRGIRRGPVNSPHKWPVTRKMFPFDDVIMAMIILHCHSLCKKCLTYRIHLYNHFLEYNAPKNYTWRIYMFASIKYTCIVILVNQIPQGMITSCFASPCRFNKCPLGRSAHWFPKWTPANFWNSHCCGDLMRRDNGFICIHLVN